MKKFWLSILVAFVSVAIVLPAQARVNYGKFEVVTDTTSNRLILEGDTITAEDPTASVQLIHKDGEWILGSVNWSESDTSGLSTGGDGYLPEDPATSSVNMNGNEITSTLGIGFDDATSLTTSPEKCSSGEALNNTGCENLQDSSSNEKPVSVSTTHTQWSSGLNDEEIWRSVNNYSDTFVITRFEFRSKGDTTAADTASVRVVDESDSTVLISQEVDGSTTPSSLTSTGDTHTIEITNQTGNDLIGSVNLQGRYE